jgi:tetratricopeptide (TPR) repeat protein
VATAQIFLSYAREDIRKAERLAACLEAAGHSVWWDTQIQGGARFASAIDSALRDADVVLVLWSSASVNSAWVQDEAAAGRDAGRLVPILIEDVQPPLGFRQFQSINIKSWTGRNLPKEMPRILSAIAAVCRSGTEAPVPQQARVARPSDRKIFTAAVIAVLVSICAGGFFYYYESAKAPPSVLVAASGKAAGQRSTELAHNVALDLGRFQAGPLSGLNIAESDQGQSRKADYRIEVGVVPSLAGLHADVAMLDRMGVVLWTASADSVAGNATDLRQQMAAQVGAVLACVVHTPSMSPRPTGEILSLYLAGCARLGDAPSDRNDETTLAIFRRITQKEPRLAEGWAGLALIESGTWENVRDADMVAANQSARADLKRAQQLNPKLDMVYAAEGRLIAPWDRNWWTAPLDTYDRGLKANPDSALLYGSRSERLLSVGRMDEAVESARRAVELDPLSTTNRDTYISSLAYAGHAQAANRELEAAERIWPGSAVIENMRYRFDLRYGDAKNALRLIKERGDLIGVIDGAGFDTFLAARIARTDATRDVAIATALNVYQHNPERIFPLLQVLGTFGRVDQAFGLLKSDGKLIYLRFGSDILWRPDMRSIRADPRFMGLAYRLGLTNLWRQTDIWPDFCQDPQLSYDCRKEAAKYPAANPVFSPPPQTPASATGP